MDSFTQRNAVSLAWLKSSITEPQQLEYFKSVFLIIPNVTIRMVFAETVIYLVTIHCLKQPPLNRINYSYGIVKSSYLAIVL